MSCPFLSLEALDSRLAVKKNIASLPSRWKTWEFRFYTVMFAIVVPIMFKTAMEASNESNPNYPRYQHILSDGWIFGRKVDNSDQQYKFFRDNFVMLLGFVGVHRCLRVASYYLKVSRINFDLAFGLTFIFAIHGWNSLKILFHVIIMFALGKISIKNKLLSQILLWTYGISTLFINDRYRLVKFGQLTSILSFMDEFKGLISRWDVFFNFTLLRMLSFNIDYIRAQQKIEDGDPIPTSDKAKTSEERKDSPIGEISYALGERQRLDFFLQIQDYSFKNYLSYLLYTPLFIAGPIITFNDYMYQTFHRLPSITLKRTFIYGLRLIFCFLVMEFILHYIYVVAVSKAKAWQGDTPFQISMIGLFNLNIIWMKLLIPWRLFRFWALCDEIDPPENMIRCMDNNFSTMQFWRAWHRSYNKWIIRYIYVPLGGAKYRILGSLAVFSFVAIWHDIELKLLIWGWLVVLFLMPELIATQLIKPYTNTWWYRHVCALGAVFNIWMMMLANLFGFCLGKDGLQILLKDMFTTVDGFAFFLTSSACLFIASQVMFEFREDEKRRGILVRC
ncbi:O-acyltransferase [Martiniozyma asiatica (nom. inval.)]|nr:O-acyltransferase [Martiniozyma asiatica]